MPSILCNWLQQILPLAKKVADEIVSEDTEILNLVNTALKKKEKKKKRNLEGHTLAATWLHFLASLQQSE